MGLKEIENKWVHFTDLRGLWPWSQASSTPNTICLYQPPMCIVYTCVGSTFFPATMPILRSDTWIFGYWSSRSFVLFNFHQMQVG